MKLDHDELQRPVIDRHYARAPHSAVAVETTRGLTQMAEMWQMGARLSGRSLSSSAIISILHLSPSLFHFRLKAYFFGKILHHRLLVASGLSFTDSVWTRSFAWRFLFFCSFFVFLAMCGRLSWFPVSFWAQLIVSYRIVSVHTWAMGVFVQSIGLEPVSILA